MTTSEGIKFYVVEYLFEENIRKDSDFIQVIHAKELPYLHATFKRVVLGEANTLREAKYLIDQATDGYVREIEEKPFFIDSDAVAIFKRGEYTPLHDEKFYNFLQTRSKRDYFSDEAEMKMFCKRYEEELNELGFTLSNFKEAENYLMELVEEND